MKSEAEQRLRDLFSKVESDIHALSRMTRPVSYVNVDDTLIDALRIVVVEVSRGACARRGQWSTPRGDPHHDQRDLPRGSAQSQQIEKRWSGSAHGLMRPSWTSGWRCRCRPSTSMARR